MYNIAHLIALLTPNMYATQRTKILLGVLLSPLSLIKAQFIAARAEDIFKVQTSPQVFSLEKMLNDRFDHVLRRITIADGQPFERIYIYTESEPEIIYLPLDDNDTSNSQVYLDLYAGASDFDFIIHLNGVSLTQNQINQLTSMVNYFKLAGKRWKLA